MAIKKTSSGWPGYLGSVARCFTGKNTYSRLKLLCAALGDPVADKFKADSFAVYRARRLAEGISANNLNREHAYLRAVFNELARLGVWKADNPMASIRQLKISEKEMAFLTLEQIRSLLLELEKGRNVDAVLIAKVCLSTGARWSEAEELRVSQVRDGMLHFSGTKSGKNRSVPICEDLQAELMKVAAGSNAGRIFKAASSQSS